MSTLRKIQDAITMNQMTFAEIAIQFDITERKVQNIWDRMNDPDACYYDQISEPALSQI